MGRQPYARRRHWSATARFLDADGFGAGPTVQACTAPAGHVATGGDCADADAATHPGAADIPNHGIDEDCNGAEAATTGTGTGSSGDPTADRADADDKGGCGCATGAPGGPWVLALLAVASRRRRALGRPQPRG